MNFKKNKDKLKRMILISPELFDKLKSSLNFGSALNNFDREIYKILKDKNLNTSQKWYRYRQILMRQSEIQRKKHNLPLKPENRVDITQNVNLPNKNKNSTVLNRGTQTKRIFRRDISTEITPKVMRGENRRSLEELIFESGGNGVDTVDNENPIEKEFTSQDVIDIESNDYNDEHSLDTSNLIPEKEFDELPKDVQNSFIRKANEYIKNSPSAESVPEAIGILGEDGTVYHIDADGVKNRIAAKFVTPKMTNKSKALSLPRTRQYLSRTAKGVSQTRLNFPTKKLKNTSVKWDSIK